MPIHRTFKVVQIWTTSDGTIGRWDHAQNLNVTFVGAGTSHESTGCWPCPVDSSDIQGVTNL